MGRARCEPLPIEDADQGGGARDTDDAGSWAISFDDVAAAATRLTGHIRRTPVLRSGELDRRSGAAVHLKGEHLQRSGSFKARGAHNRLLTLSADELARGVVTVSSGNHATALACAGQRLGVTVDVYMPSDAPRLKQAASRGYGARVHLFDRRTTVRQELVEQHAEQTGSVIVEPYDDPMIMAGQGTAALELLDDVHALDALVVPMSGGGLMAGCAITVAARHPNCRLIGVEPDTADDTRRSFAAASRQEIPVPETIAEGLAVTMPGALTFPINRALVENILTVSDEQMIDAMELLFERTKQVVEPSGAAGIAAVLGGDVDGDRIGVIVSGGNIDVGRFADLTGSQRLAPGR